MKLAEKPRLEAEPARLVYRYVERRGAVDPDAVPEDLDLDDRTYEDALATLQREGYVVSEDGALRLAIDAGGAETHAVEGVEYTVRPARQEDFEGILKVIRRIVDERTYVVAETVAEQLLYEDAVIRHNDAKSRLFFVATADDAVVGWTHLDRSPIERLGHTAQQTIGVLEPYRGYGIGGRLMQRGLEWAVENGVRKLYNSLPATNEEAIEFLASHGCTVEAVRSDHYLIDGEYVDEVTMAIDPAEAPAGPDAPSEATVWEDVIGQLERSLEADEATTARFHVRQAMQFVELGLADRG